ncbi:MAG: hypothetical protein KF744_16140 [Taibaiella sp.]|nr:hypothetical protein [Taibaiella sp.]
MKILFSILLIGICSFILPNSAFAKQYHATGSVQGTYNGQPCLIQYDVTINYDVVFGMPPIQITSIHGSISGCGGSYQFMVVPTYNNGGSVGQDPNGQNIVTSLVWSGIEDEDFAAYLGSQQMQSVWCNEINSVIVPQLPTN